MMEEIEKILREAGVTATPVRKLVYKCISESDRPLSLSDIEISLDSVDKSSISRTLSLFRDNQLVHSFNDGSGSMKYEICKSVDSEKEMDMHVHFHCEKCGRTICFTEMRIPDVKLPEGYVITKKNYIISGLCSHCAEKRYLTE